jgi:hypothetical protein
MARRSIIQDAVEQLIGIIPMGNDPRRLKPGVLVQTLNSTPLGEVHSDRLLRRHREQAGMRIGDGKSIDLLRYAAWLCQQELAGQAKPRQSTADPAIDPYQLKKLREAARNREKSRAGRDIAPLPEVINPDRREACRYSFRLFCETYFPDLYDLAWSKDHLKVIAKIERVVMKGGLFAIAMPRGNGKSTLCECACLWASLYGYRKYIVLLGSSADAAEESLLNIKTQLEENELLAEDFPEVCYPISAIEGRAANCQGQLLNGRQTYMDWSADIIILPYVPESKASGVIIRATGLTSRLRGMKRTRPHDGKSVRPDLVLPDDPQTDESANSVSQCRYREKLLSGTVLGLAGPGKKIAGLMPVTVIRRGDMADNALDQHKHPEWQGERCKMLYKFPDNMKLWDEYCRLLSESLRTKGDISLATEYYLANRHEMEAGADVAWPDRYEPDEVSGLQCAMNLYFRDRSVFFAEYQNDPEGDAARGDELMESDDIAVRFSNLIREMVPAAATKLTAMIDVQHSLLYWTVVAWTDDFTGYVIDYGAWPEQQRAYFKLREADPTLDIVYPGRSVQACVYAGLQDLTDELLSKEWTREDGASLRIDRCLVDGKDEAVAEEVYTICRTSSYSSVLIPSTGRGIGVQEKPMHQYKPKPGERLGRNWIITKSGKYSMRHLVIDVNYWKSFVHDRLETPVGERSALTFYGRRGTDHRLIADHLTAEYRETITSDKTNRKVTVWRARPGRPDNHWFDCIVGSACAASVEGCELAGTGDQPKKRERVSFAEIQRRRRLGL